MKKNILTVLLMFLMVSAINGQEYLTGLPENPVIKQERKVGIEYKSTRISWPVPVNLPFKDNFKQTTIFPDTARWSDDYVFINADFPINPPTWGVATFDAIDANGNIYPGANPLQFPADMLTSRPIRLDSIFAPVPRALSPADSAYLSFYYQPQGRGNDPQEQDSLVLEFGFFTPDSVFSFIDSIEVTVGAYINPDDTLFPGDFLSSPCGDTAWWTMVVDTLFAWDYITLPCDSVFTPKPQWNYVWSSPGMSLDTFRVKNDTAFFKQVMIPVVDTQYFRNDFQFRFRNFASIASDNLQSWQSNCDYWNIDNVYLNIERNIADTTYKEITFVEQAPSFLKEYSSMPFYQYKNDPTNVMKGGFELKISNLDKINQTAVYTYEVRNDAGGLVYDYDGGSWSLEVFEEYGFVTYPPFAYPPVNGIFPAFGNKDSTYFDITHYLLGDPTLGLGDTISYRQNFSNFYAYDDGTPEFGYGLTPAGAKLAYQFTLSIRDTLRAVRMMFNKTFTNANEQFFDLAIWKDLNGAPGDLIYLQEKEKPLFGENLYQYQTYYLDTAVPLFGTFYIGWIQSSYHNLNLGFDSHNDASSHIFYNTSGKWDKSSYKGSLMIRPVFGKSLRDEPVLKSVATDFFNLAPNPSEDGRVSVQFMVYEKGLLNPQKISVKDEILSRMEVEVFNILGQRVYHSDFQPVLDLSGLQRGVYLVRINNDVYNQTMVQKLIISR